jgi:hypothetical protein
MPGDTPMLRWKIRLIVSAVPNPARRAMHFHHDVRVVPGQPRAVRPMGRGAAAVQQTEAG